MPAFHQDDITLPDHFYDPDVWRIAVHLVALMTGRPVVQVRAFAVQLVLDRWRSTPALRHELPEHLR